MYWGRCAGCKQPSLSLPFSIIAGMIGGRISWSSEQTCRWFDIYYLHRKEGQLSGLGIVVKQFVVIGCLWTKFGSSGWGRRWRELKLSLLCRGPVQVATGRCKTAAHGWLRLKVLIATLGVFSYEFDVLAWSPVLSVGQWNAGWLFTTFHSLDTSFFGSSLTRHRVFTNWSLTAQTSVSSCWRRFAMCIVFIVKSDLFLIYKTAKTWFLSRSFCQCFVGDLAHFLWHIILIV